MNAAIRFWWGRFHRQLNGIEQIARIALCYCSQVMAGIVVHDHFLLAITHLRVSDGALDDGEHVIFSERLQ
ncbi:hypothetical protein SDC9_211834 [bioreactor metagenome]|uniref:Uncharacterized protein n=1 Tax=bioreactor metagenome TaxID=1076179 RepID=A0A645JY77_9ZZZZ